jgi:GNAT superfamily N-acetyltransferase
VLLSAFIPVELAERDALRCFFLPERPGPQTALQALGEPRDMCLVDRWPEPRAVVVVAPGDLVLAGDPDVLRPADLRALAHRGMIEAPPTFSSLLQRAYPDLRLWPRVVYTLQDRPTPPLPARITVRRLEVNDGQLARALHREGKWLWKHHRGPEELAASGLAWAAIADERCVSIALPYTRGEMYEDLGTFTDPSFRGMGLSSACVTKVIEDVLRRGRVPSWSTSVDHKVSQRVAQKTGFQKDREDFVYVTGPDLAGSQPLREGPIPPTARLS